MEPLGYVVILGGTTAALIGLAVGLLAPWFPRGPGLFSLVIIAIYILLVAASVGWTATCPSCGTLAETDSSRVADIFIAVFWGFVVFAPVIAITLISALLSTWAAARGQGQV